MKISTRLKVAGTCSLAIVAVIGTVSWHTKQQVESELAKSATAGDVLLAVSSLRYLTLEYVSRHEGRAQTQWQLRNASLRAQLANMAQFTSAEEHEVLGNLRDTDDSVNALFTQLVTLQQDRRTDKSEAGVIDELEDRLIGQISNKTQSMISDAVDLTERSRAAVLAAQRQSTVALVTAGGIVVAVIATTLLLALRRVVRPLAVVRAGTAIVGAGDLDFRLDIHTRDEVGDLAQAFDAMTDKLRQTTVSRDVLARANEELHAEAVVRREAEQRVRAQLARLNLLQQITRAIGERQDLRSIFQVVIGSIEEQLPVDFSCICLYQRADHSLTVMSVGQRTEGLALELAMTERARIAIDENGLSRCVRGELVYEPDIGGVEFPFPQRLARGGLKALVVAPLLVESQVFGVLVAARRQAESFVSGECEFLRHLSEHVALAAHQAELHGALQGAYDDLRQTQQAVMQQERLRALGQMASGIAHDINNAISPVSLYVELMLEKEPGLSELGRSYLQTTLRAIDDVAQTIARLREFYRRREPEVMLSTVHLGRLAQQVIDLTRARWSDMPQQGGTVIKIQTDFAPDTPGISGSEAEVREALVNLVFNAVDAMPEGGTLSIRTGLTDAAADSTDIGAPRRAYIEIADTGVGMDEDTRARCAEPFFTTKGERGTGLGLAMVYGVAQRHGAEFEIESAVRQGTKIRLTFPRSAVASETAQDDTAHGLPKRLRILIVDDDPMLLKSLRDTLEADGHVVVAANGGQAGIDAFCEAKSRHEMFAVVITDLGMPHVDGRRVAEAIKMASVATPVILLTGWGRRMAAQGDTPAHVNCVLSKPPKLHELRRALAQCCATPA